MKQQYSMILSKICHKAVDIIFIWSGWKQDLKTAQSLKLVSRNVLKGTFEKSSMHAGVGKEDFFPHFLIPKANTSSILGTKICWSVEKPAMVLI